jgi:hypothetical protein
MFGPMSFFTFLIGDDGYKGGVVQKKLFPKKYIIMDNKDKLEAIKAFLTENNLNFEENHFSKSKKINIDLVVYPYRIAVHLSDDTDKEFFNKTKRHYHPFFIRDNETEDFVLEKMQNCIIEEMKKHHQVRVDKQPEPVVEKKRKRVRITAERVTPVRK